MRKLLTFVSALSITGSLLAGGLVTNTNQSASWVRLPARNASTSIDAVYYNPAGLMKLENGFHVSLSNQSIFQSREIENNYAGPGGAYGLNQHVYEGSVTALAFPSVSAAYKMDKFAFSLGFYPVGGGGGATYEKGLPSFEMSPSDLVPALASQGASAYRLDAYLKGSSTFLGFQGGISYKINDWLSIAAGARYVTAKNTYDGHLTDIEVNMGGTWTRADLIMKGIAGSYTTAAAGSSQLVAGGAGSLTFAQAQGLGLISATQRAQFEGALTAVGYPAATPIATADQIYKGTAIKYNANATLLGDQTVKSEQTGSGVTPVLSVNISPSENLNIAIKYEMATKLELENNTTSDFLVGYENSPTTGLPDQTKPITMFPNGALTRNDMPAMLAIGVDYRISESLKLSLGSNYFFDKSSDYGHKVDDDLKSSTPSVHIDNSEIIDDNGMSFQIGLEYNISKKLLVSGGYVWANQGVNDLYQSDLTYGLGTQTFGAGGAYSINDKIQINLGFGYTLYMEDSKTVDHIFSATGANIQANETYRKNTMMVGVGVDFRF
jgi:long-chain fatty acid transport protein